MIFVVTRICEGLRPSLFFTGKRRAQHIALPSPAPFFRCGRFFCAVRLGEIARGLRGRRFFWGTLIFVVTRICEGLRPSLFFGTTTSTTYRASFARAVLSVRAFFLCGSVRGNYEGLTGAPFFWGTLIFVVTRICEGLRPSLFFTGKQVALMENPSRLSIKFFTRASRVKNRAAPIYRENRSLKQCGSIF